MPKAKAKTKTTKKSVKGKSSVKSAASKKAAPKKAVKAVKAAPKKAPAKKAKIVKPSAGRGSAAKAPKGNLGKIRSELLAEQARLKKRLGHMLNDDVTADSSNVGDIADVAAHHENREILRELQSTEEEQLRHVDAALLRIEKGTYGNCERCGSPIEPARLEALPYAPTCISCRRREERGEFGAAQI